MTINPKMVLSPPLNQWMVNKDTGLPLAAGGVFFYRDSARNTKKPVYQLTGSPPNYSFIPVDDPITLTSVGTFQNANGDNIAIYFYPFEGTPNDTTPSEVQDLYYVVCRSTSNVTSTVQWTREAWPAGAGGGGFIPNQAGESSLENQISNPQFTRVLINEGLTTTFSQVNTSEQVYPIAPGWDLVVTGASGTSVQVTQVALQGSAHIPTSPPYALDIVTSAGITSCRLRQRFYTNSGLWASTVNLADNISNYLAASITGIAFSANQGVSIVYKESSGNPERTLLTALLVTSGYQTFDDTSNVAIQSSGDTNSGDNGYVDIFVVLPTSAHVRITSIQVVPLASADDVAYDLQSSNRMQAYMGDYYIPRLEEKAIPSILTAWDFPLNPAQAPAPANMTASPAYIWDQLICARVTTANTFTRGATGGFEVTVGGANDAFYMMQYLSGQQVKELIGNRLSVNVNAWKGSVGADNSVQVRVYLYRGGTTTPAVIPIIPLTIGSLATSGVFTLNSTLNQGLNWTEIGRSNLDTASAYLTTIATNDQLVTKNTDYGFNGWEITSAAEINDTDKFAMVVTFVYATASTVITVQSISLVPGDIPTRPAPQSFQSVLTECQYYYETSYELGVTIPTSTTNGSVIDIQQADVAGGNANCYASAFQLDYKTPKRSGAAVPVFYDLATTINTVTASVYSFGGGASASAVIGNWTLAAGSTHGTSYTPATNNVLATIGALGGIRAYIRYHYVVDDRLGII